VYSKEWEKRIISKKYDCKRGQRNEQSWRWMGDLEYFFKDGRNNSVIVS
jgi:hypothetical protein